MIMWMHILSMRQHPGPGETHGVLPAVRAPVAEVTVVEVGGGPEELGVDC